MAKVTHLTSVHPAHDVRIFLKECRSLADAGYAVSLLAVSDRNEIRAGVTIKAVPQARTRAQRLLVGPRLLKMALAEHARLYHLHDPELIPLGLLLKALGKRVIYDAHENVPAQIMSKDWIPRILRPLVASVMAVVETSTRAFDGVIVVAGPVEARLPRSKTVIVENLPRLEEFQVADAIPYSDRPSLVLYLGGITVTRGALDMVAAMRLLPPELMARLSVAGMCQPLGLADELRQMAGETGVALLGWQDRVQVAGLLVQSRVGLVLLHPTPNYLRAPRATKLLEYMAAGIPVIVTDLPLMRAFVEEIGCGLVVPPHDPHAVADAIQWLLEHPQEAEQMGERGRQAVLTRYNWDAESRKLLDLYRRILGDAAPAARPQ